MYCDWVSESSFFIRPLAVFTKPDMTVDILSASSADSRKGFHILTSLLKPGISSLYQVSVGIYIIKKGFHRSSFKMSV